MKENLKFSYSHLKFLYHRELLKGLSLPTSRPLLCNFLLCFWFFPRTIRYDHSVLNKINIIIKKKSGTAKIMENGRVSLFRGEWCNHRNSIYIYIYIYIYPIIYFPRPLKSPPRWTHRVHSLQVAMSFISRPSETSTTVGLSSFLALCLRCTS